MALQQLKSAQFEQYIPFATEANGTIDFTQCTLSGGTIDDGHILGGTIHGTTIEDGIFWAGLICGGVIEDTINNNGTICGGTICGSTLQDVTFYSGGAGIPVVASGKYLVLSGVQ